MQSIRFVESFALDDFKNNFQTLPALGACHVNNIGGVVYQKSIIFAVFWEYLVFLYFFVKSFFVIRSYLVVVIKIKTLIMIALFYPVNEAQSPDFGRFLTILGIFRAVFFSAQAFDLQNFSQKKQFNVCTFTCSKRFIHDIKL